MTLLKGNRTIKTVYRINIQYKKNIRYKKDKHVANTDYLLIYILLLIIQFTTSFFAKVFHMIIFSSS